jgi:hypothetical protein
MRWVNVLFCCLFLAVFFVGASAPLLATDLKSPPQAGRRYSDTLSEKEATELCYKQGDICRKICNLRFRDDLVGCPQSCESRVPRCIRTGCYRWTEPEFLIAERFGGFRCPY